MQSVISVRNRAKVFAFWSKLLHPVSAKNTPNRIFQDKNYFVKNQTHAIVLPTGMNSHISENLEELKNLSIRDLR